METEKETCMRPKWMTKLLHCSRSRGGITSQQLPGILAELNLGLNVDQKTLSRLITANSNGSGVLDFDTVTKILFQLILKQPSDTELDASSYNDPSIIFNQSGSDCCCDVQGECGKMKITDFIIFPTF